MTVHLYASVSDLADRLGIEDDEDNVKLNQILEAVSGEIETAAGRRFWTTTADEDRYYTASDGGVVFTDDIISVTSLASDDAMNGTYSTVWSLSDYHLAPRNAAAKGKPYTAIATTPNERRSFTTLQDGVKVTGKFGYSATVPPVVREACLLQAERLFKRKDAPFGVMGSPDTGYVRLLSALDPDVDLLLDSVRKLSL